MPEEEFNYVFRINLEFICKKTALKRFKMTFKNKFPENAKLDVNRTLHIGN